MLNKLLTYSFLILLSVCFAPPAEAQRKSDFRDSLDFLLDDGEMSKEEMEMEAMGIFNRCMASLFKKTYYDCECIGGAFLSEREEVGPYVTQYDILRKVYLSTPECVNDTEIAGMAYSDCINDAKITRRNDKNNEEYCTCVAHGTVVEFAKTPSLRNRAIESTRSRAIVSCMAEYPPESFTRNRSLYSNK